MFQILVTSISNAPIVTEGYKPTKIVGLLDPDTKPPMILPPEQYHIEHFYDVKNLREAETVAILTEGTNALYPRRANIERILNFTKDLTDTDRVLVHCHAGQSRSTAMAISIMCQHGSKPKDAMWHINKIRHGNIWPNNLIIDLSDTILGMNGILIKEFEEWKEEKNLIYKV